MLTGFLQLNFQRSVFVERWTSGVMGVFSACRDNVREKIDFT